MNSLDSVFKPKSIAIIGATTRPGSIGREILRNLFDYEFNGKIFPVNPKYEYIHSTKAYPTVLSIPDEVDLAIIVVPKEQVATAVEDCGRKGVKGLVVISAGFKETGGEGVKREEEIVEIIKRYNMRMVGPNCMGIINATPNVLMNATFSPGVPSGGGMAFMTQSGALGVAILLVARKLGIGFSYFASVGNKADIAGTDLLEYWENDEYTRVIGLYLESFGDPRLFTELSKRISKNKPIVVVKSGTSAAGARAASSHTGSLAGLEVAADALLHQCGVIRVSSIGEMIDIVAGFSQAPLPKGDRIAIVTNAGGPAIMAADNVEAQGLRMAELSEETQNKLREFLVPEAAVGNPVDMIAAAGPVEYEKALDLLLADPGVDMAIPIFVPPLIVGPLDVMRKITAMGRKHGKPVLSVLMAEDQHYESIPKEIENPVPFYRFPEPAVKVASEMYRYQQWREAPAGEVREFDADIETARKIVATRSARGGGYLPAEDVYRVLEATGFSVCRYASVPVKGHLGAVAKEIGFPLVLKVEGEKIVHKSDVGGVVVGIRSEAELHEARADMEKSLGKAGLLDQVTGYFVQEMAKPGQEIILGVAQDRKFGPLLMFGMGGKYVEILRDVSFRVMPVTDVDAREMVRSIKSYPLLEGVRGEQGVDIEHIVESIQRLAFLVSEVDGIEELDMNPIIVTPDRADSRVVDARIRVR